MSGQAKSRQVNSGHVKSGHVKSGQVQSGQVKSGHIKSGQVKLGMFKSGQVFFSTGPQRTNSNLHTGFRSIGCLVVEKSRFSDRG